MLLGMISKLLMMSFRNVPRVNNSHLAIAHGCTTALASTTTGISSFISST